MEDGWNWQGCRGLMVKVVVWIVKEAETDRCNDDQAVVDLKRTYYGAR